MTQECQAYKTQLLDFFSGNLTAEQSAPVLAHLEQCAACRQLAEDLGVMPYLSLLDETRLEESIARVRAAISTNEREKASVDAAALTWVDKISTQWHYFFRRSFAVPATAFASAAALLLVWFLGGFSFTGLTPTSTESQITDVLAASWLPAVEERTGVDAIFESYVLRRNLDGLRTLGGEVNEMNGETATPSSLMGILFAVMTAGADDGLISSAVLVDRDREILLSVAPVPDRVLLRAMDIRDVEGDIFLEQRISLHDSVVCQAHAVARDPDSGVTLLFAPGIDRMLSLLEIPTPFDVFEIPPGLVKAKAAGFLLSQTNREGAAFFYEAPLKLQADRDDDEKTILALYDDVPASLPGRMPLFSDDGRQFLGVVIQAAKSGPWILSGDTIDTLVADAGPTVHEAQESYQAWLNELNSLVATLSEEDLPQHLELSPAVVGTVQLREDIGRVLTVDFAGDGVYSVSIPLEYPGLLLLAIRAEK